MSAPTLIDTGPIVAILVESDQHHRSCVEQLRLIRVPLLTCWPVLTEAAWLLRAYPQAVRKLLSAAGGHLFQIADLGEADLPGITAVLWKYRSLGLQLADASLVHLAEREGIQQIFTLDRRDFGVVRLTHGRKFRLLP